MYEKLTENDIRFCELWYDPTALTECLIPQNFKAAHTWGLLADCLRVRNYQFAFQNYSYVYGKNSKLNEKENFDIIKNAGTCFNIAARNLGKSLWILIDAFLNVIHNPGDESCIGSPDDQKLKKICNPLINLFRDHPFFDIFRKTGKNEGLKNQPVQVETRHGHVLYGRNEKVESPNPGTQFQGLHSKVVYYEEFSMSSKAGMEQRIDAVSSLGCIERYSGIPDLRIGSPLGDILADPKNKNFICRIPQSIRNDWNEKIAEDLASKYGGKNSLGYKLNVEAELTEAAFGKYDMERIRKNCLNYEKKIKFFEISKEDIKRLETISDKSEKISEAYKIFDNKIILTRLPCERILIVSDIGTSGSPSEVCIFFGTKDRWIYEYQVSIFKFILKEQALFFKWLYDKMGTCFIILDNSNADGVGIRDELIIEYKIPEIMLPKFMMQQNLDVGFEQDEKGRILRSKSGQPILKVVNTKAWAFQQLESILYNGKCEISYDEKFLRQFGGIVEYRNNNRTSWGSSTEEHLHDSFLLFGLGVWQIQNKNTNNLNIEDIPLGYFD